MNDEDWEYVKIQGIHVGSDGEIRLNFNAKDQISKYLEKLRENEGKDHMEIASEIEQREKNRHASLLEIFLAERYSSEKMEKLNEFEQEK